MRVCTHVVFVACACVRAFWCLCVLSCRHNHPMAELPQLMVRFTSAAHRCPGLPLSSPSCHLKGLFRGSDMYQYSNERSLAVQHGTEHEIANPSSVGNIEILICQDRFIFTDLVQNTLCFFKFPTFFKIPDAS